MSKKKAPKLKPKPRFSMDREERQAFDRYAAAILHGLAVKFTWDELKGSSSLAAIAAARIAGEAIKARRLEMKMREDNG